MIKIHRRLSSAHIDVYHDPKNPMRRRRVFCRSLEPSITLKRRLEHIPKLATAREACSVSLLDPSRSLGHTNRWLVLNWMLESRQL
jgi:hypothetical protein